MSTPARLQITLCLLLLAGLALVGCDELTPDTAPAFTLSVSDQSYTVGEAIRPLVAPEAEGGNGALRYRLDPEIPGLTFDSAARTLSGTPNTAGTYLMVYRVTDTDGNTSDGDADTLSFTVTVLVGDTAPRFNGGVADQSYTVGEAISPLVLPEALGGNGPVSYELRPEVPGITFDPGTRALSGAPSMTGMYQMTYLVTDADENTSDSDSDSLSFTTTVWPPSSVSCTYRGSGDHVCAANRDGHALDEVSVSLRLGTTRPEVHVIATNTNGHPAVMRVERLDAEADAAPHGQRTGIDHTSRPSALESAEHAPPWVVEFNNNPPLSVLRSSAPGRQPRSSQSTASRPSEVGDANVFQTLNPETASAYDIPATVRATAAGGSLAHRLAVWVADASWSDAHSTCSQVNCVTHPMVEAIARKFLKTGANNDTYDWVTAVFGAPWGDHDLPGMIGPDTEEIHILLFDIDSDESTTGGTIGFFHGGDTVLRRPDLPHFITNEKLLFYLDSVLLAEAEGVAWDLTDRWPSAVIGTLAHELQHMIHFYQKVVQRDTVSETWLNEMNSMAAEDLTAPKLGIPGPRGVAHTDGSPGAPVNRRGRLPRYNRYNDIQVTRWGGALAHYSINYALGAYLARRYGAGLFSRIVQSDWSGTEAITAAIKEQTGTNTTFGQLLVDWAVANLLSDDPGAAAPYRYNSADWFRSTAGGLTFDLGSINLYNYRYDSDTGAGSYLDGPGSYPFQEFSDGLSRYPHSNAYTTLGRVNGTVRLRVSAEAGMRIVFVMKE